MADEKYIKKTFGKTYYPITQNEMSNNSFKNFTGDKKFGNREDLNKYHSNLKEKLTKQKVRPSEIAKLDKEFKARMKRANDDVQYKLANRPGMKAEKKKQKGTIPDTGSAFAKGGRAGYKDAGKVGPMGSSSTKGNILHGKLKTQKELKKITDSDKYKKSDFNKKNKMLNVATMAKGGRAGYSVGGRAERGVSKILIKK